MSQRTIQAMICDAVVEGWNGARACAYDTRFGAEDLSNYNLFSAAKDGVARIAIKEETFLTGNGAMVIIIEVYVRKDDLRRGDSDQEILDRIRLDSAIVAERLKGLFRNAEKDPMVLGIIQRNQPVYSMDRMVGMVIEMTIKF
jgi:hypothetical protein